MVSLTALLLPILLSAVLVFILSAVIHMALGYHANDFGKLPNEEAVRAALRGTPAGDYMIPRPESAAAMRSPEHLDKLKEGPIAFMTVQPGRTMAMGRELTLWFIYTVIVSIIAAYVASRAVGPGAEYLAVFRFVGTTAFAAYGVGHWADVIWYRRSSTTALKNTFDALIYALATAGMFGWLWPS